MDRYKIYERLRDAAGETNYRVSKETGIPESTLSDWKRGASQLKADNLNKLAKHFGKTIAVFFED